MDADTEWREVFAALTASDQECTRGAKDGDIWESVLGRSVPSDSETPEAWEILMFSCLTPQTARAVLLSLMIPGMGGSDTFEVGADAEACLGEWAAGLDVATTMVALSVHDAEATKEVTTAFITCNPDLVISAVVEATGLTFVDINAEAASCLRPWVANTDWTAFLTGATNDRSTLRDFITNLLECAPNLVILAILEETGLTLEDLSEEEASCLRTRIANTDLTTLFPNEGPSLLFDVLARLYACVPGHPSSEPDDHIRDLWDLWDEMIEGATPVEIGMATRGKLEHEHDSDVFAFEATEGELYKLDVTLDTLHDSILAIFNAYDIYALAFNDNYGISMASRLIWEAPRTGTYYVQVASADDGTGTYSLTIDFSDIEDDHSDLTDNATPVETSIATQGELEHEHDSDFFAFEASEGEFYELEVTLGTLHYSVLDLYDADGNWLTSYDDSTASPLIWPAPTTGTYYVQVHSSATWTGTYTFTINLSDIEDDHPNTADNATPVEISTATQGELEYDHDSDFFAFEATIGQAYELDVTPGTLDVTPRTRCLSELYVYDADGNELTFYCDYGDSTAPRLIWRAPDTGTYYVEITKFDGTGTYTLTITVSDIVDDHPNSTDHATPVEIGIATQGELEYDHDSDFFAFEATENEFYELNVTLGTLQDSALSIYDTDRTWPIANYSDSTATWRAPDTGTYYIRVHSFATGTGTYTLTIAPS